MAARRLAIATILICALATVHAGQRSNINRSYAARVAKASAGVPAPAKYPWNTPSGGDRIPIPLGYKKNLRRTGMMYLPAGRKSWRKLKILVLLHGSGMEGNQMIDNFWELADKYQIMLVAPDSRNPMYWFAPDDNKPFNDNWWHVLACYNWARRNSRGSKFDEKKIGFLGFSRGGYSAGAMASRLSPTTHAIIIHSSVSAKQFGQHRFPIWISTGTFDWMFTQRRMTNEIQQFTRVKRGWPVTFRVFVGPHDLQNPGEIQSAVKWFDETRGAKG